MIGTLSEGGKKPVKDFGLSRGEVLAATPFLVDARKAGSPPCRIFLHVMVNFSLMRGDLTPAAFW
jgi:hypothetical protein